MKLKIDNVDYNFKFITINFTNESVKLNKIDSIGYVSLSLVDFYNEKIEFDVGLNFTNLWNIKKEMHRKKIGTKFYYGDEKPEDIEKKYNEELEIITEVAFINNLKEQKNKLPENWESLIDYYLKSVVECTNYELLDWAKGTQTNGIKYYLKKVGSFVLKEQVDFYQLLISALYVCIEDVVKDTIEKAKEQKLFKI